MQVAATAVVRQCGVVAAVERSWALRVKFHLRKLGMVNTCAVMDSERFSRRRESARGLARPAERKWESR